MNKKEEFYKFVKKDGWGYDIIEADADWLWQWIEQYGKQARLDELEKTQKQALIWLKRFSREWIESKAIIIAKRHFAYRRRELAK